MQAVGRICRTCGERIVASKDAHVCEPCGAAYHVSCSPDGCPTCGVEPAAPRAPTGGEAHSDADLSRAYVAAIAAGLYVAYLVHQGVTRQKIAGAHVVAGMALAVIGAGVAVWYYVKRRRRDES